MKLIAAVILFFAGALTAQGESPAPTGPPKPRSLMLVSPFTGEKLVVRAGAALLPGIVLMFQRRFLLGAVVGLLPVLGGGYDAFLSASKEAPWSVASNPQPEAGSPAIAKIIETGTKKPSSPDERQLRISETDVNDFQEDFRSVQWRLNGQCQFAKRSRIL